MDEAILPLELLNVLRLSLRATASSSVDSLEQGSALDPSNPVTRKIIAEVLFSRRFILSYYVVIGAIVAAFASIHWFRKVGRWHKRRNMKTEGTPGHGTPRTVSSSSSSSTLHGDTTAPIKAFTTVMENEQMPLLAHDGGLDVGPRGMAARVYHRVRGFLMYQPRPFSALTAPCNTLPPNGTTLCILVFLTINLFYLFYHTPLSLSMLFVFADRAGLCFVANLPLLYLLAAKTNQPLRFLTGWSYEGLNLLHRRLGEWMTAFGTLHSFGMFGVWYTLLRPQDYSWLRFVSSRLVLVGIFALVAYVAIYVTSVGWIRQLYYEVFLGLHIILQVGALVFLFFHHHGARPYVLAALGIWALDRMVSRMVLSSKKFVATLEVAPDQQTVLLFCDIPSKKSTTGVTQHMSHGWRAGQHVFVTVPGLGWKHQLQAHPFTIASPAPPRNAAQQTWPLQLIIRARNGFSKELLAFAQSHQHVDVWLDGPYGSTEVLEAVQCADRVLLVAGGSGIAVTYPLSWELQVKQTEGALATRSKYRNGIGHTPSLVDCGVRAPADRDECYHLWIRQDPLHDGWITLFPPCDVASSTSRPDPSADANEELVYGLIHRTIDTRGPSDRRPDMKTELRDWIERSTATRPQNPAQTQCIVVSGPDSLVRDVQNGAALLVRAGYKIEVHVEKFGW